MFFKLQDRPCLVVGGGEVGTRKAQMFLRAGGQVKVIALEASHELKAQAQTTAALTVIERGFEDQDVQGQALIIVATENSELNRHVYALATAQGIPVNVADQTPLCTFIFGSIVDRDPILIAISSSGASPVLARLLKSKLETWIPATYGRLAAVMGGFRGKVKQRFKAIRTRRLFWEEVLQGPFAEMAMSGRLHEAEQYLDQYLDSTQSPNTQGEVYLIGAGPGDPDLMTFKALRLLQKADVVLYDRLVAKPIMDLARKEAELIYVGKIADDHVMPQTSITELLIKYAKQGQKVARLKGGDPFMFGRGGEEIQALTEQQVPFQVVPGVTAASGCAAYAGIPLTHRDYAYSCRFVTGHLKDDSLNLDWQGLAQPKQTVVFYMGMKNLAVICQQLMQHGAPGTRKVALVEQGTTPGQRVITGTLATLPEQVKDFKAKPPSLIIVGDVVTLKDQLNWYENRFQPLDESTSAFSYKHQ